MSDKKTDDLLVGALNEISTNNRIAINNLSMRLSEVEESINTHKKVMFMMFVFILFFLIISLGNMARLMSN